MVLFLNYFVEVNISMTNLSIFTLILLSSVFMLMMK